MTSVNDLHPDQLRSLLNFYADAGVEWLLEETPVDRIAEMQALRAAQGERRAVEQAPAAPERENRPAPSRPESRTVERRPARETAPAVPAVAIPDSQAVAEAGFAASSARSLGELRTAMEGFTGCNLRHSARGLVFADGNERPAIMVIGPMPNADDDREGLPFAGRQGAMLDRMLAGIGIARADVRRYRNDPPDARSVARNPHCRAHRTRIGDIASAGSGRGPHQQAPCLAGSACLSGRPEALDRPKKAEFSVYFQCIDVSIRIAAIATARVTSRGRRIFFAEAQVALDSGLVVATAMGNFRYVSARG